MVVQSKKPSEPDESIGTTLRQDIIDSIRLYFSPFLALADELAGRINEKAIVIPALRAAASRPNGYISTSELIIELEKKLRPGGEDAEVLLGRRDSQFSQIVRNLKSHRESSTSMFRRGLAVEKDDGFQITEKGLKFLSQLPDSKSGNRA